MGKHGTNYDEMHIPARRNLERFFDDEIEPKALCHNCEYFDGGGLSPGGHPINDMGDCRNQRAPRFTTHIDLTCDQFFPCSTRWPEADHG